MKLDPRRKYHEGRAALRHYANQPAHPLLLLRWRPNFTSTSRGVNARLAQCLKCDSGSKGILRDCEN